MTDRASVHTGNASEQFLHRNRTLILVHTVPEQTPIRYSVNKAFDHKPAKSSDTQSELQTDTSRTRVRLMVEKQHLFFDLVKRLVNQT